MPRVVDALILVCLSAFASQRGKAGVASGFHFEVEPIVTGDDAQADALRGPSSTSGRTTCAWMRRAMRRGSRRTPSA